MNNIANYIEELLYEFDSIIIPGFGGFISSYKSVTIDYVQGLLHPPSKTLTFHDNFTVDDGMLTHFIKNKEKASLEEVQNAVNDYVRKTKLALENREIVVFPNVGRLYKDYEGKLQFLQDNTNFNMQAFGLPMIQFYPILRSKETVLEEAPMPITDVAPKAKPSRVATFARIAQKVMPALIVLGICMIALTVYMLNVEKPTSDIKKIPVSERLNQKPTLSYAALGVPTDDNSERSTAIEEVLEENEEYATYDTEAITDYPKQKECIIIIGAFKSKSGVRKRIEDIYELGFDAYKNEKRGLTRIGIQFAYDTETEVIRNLKLMKKKFDKSAYVLEEK